MYVSSKVQAFKQNGKQQNVVRSSIRGCRITYRAASVIRSSMSPDVHLKVEKREKHRIGVETPKKKLKNHKV